MPRDGNCKASALISPFPKERNDVPSQCYRLQLYNSMVPVGSKRYRESACDPPSRSQLRWRIRVRREIDRTWRRLVK